MDRSIEYIIGDPLNISSSLVLHLCGKEKCAPGHSFGPAMRPHYLFHYILDGKGIFVVGDKTYQLNSGQGFLISPGVSTFYAADDHNPWNYCWFGFDGLDAKTILERCSLTLENPIYTDQSDGLLKNALLNLGESFEHHQDNEYKLIAQLYLVFSLMCNTTDIETSCMPIKQYGHKATEFIKNNYIYNIKINDVARHIGIERSYLYKIFMQLYHCSPQQYLIRHRLLMACRLLESTNASITEISYSCGFKDPSAFNKHFKNCYGKTPTNYRKHRGIP